MATVKEMMMQDAANSVETAYMMSAGDTFEGTLSSKFDEDWIRIEMTAGMLYTINLAGADTGGVTDTFLKLYDSKGGFIKQNDDEDGDMGKLNSTFQFIPDVSGVYYISAGAYTANLGQMNEGKYTVTVAAMTADLTRGPDIPGTGMADKLRGTEKGELLDGMGGDDSLFGLGGDDTLDGGPGSDLLRGGPGSDILIGGVGLPTDKDTISYRVSPAGVTINLADGTARGGHADGDEIRNNAVDGKIENVVGSSHDDVLTGDRHANELWGLGGIDELTGDRGNDTLNGGGGDDELDGGRGDDELEGGPGGDVLIGGGAGSAGDIASYAGSMMGVEVRLHSSKFSGGDAKDDSFGKMVEVEYTTVDEDGENPMDHTAMLPDIKNLTGSAHADVLAGDMRNNTIKGGDGGDMIFGGPSPKGATGAGDDTNVDTLMGEGGNDMIYGGVGDDMLFGNAGNDTLVGGPGDDTYYGGAGSDMIYADAADATINGWVMTPPADDATTTTVNESVEVSTTAGIVGADQMAVDTVSYARVENEDDEGVTRALNDPGIDPATATATGGTTIINVENIIGTQYVDNLTGNSGNNVIEGGDGGDTLNGAAGIDTLSYESSDERVRVELNDAADTNAQVSKGHARGDQAQNFENVTGSAFDDELEGNTGDNVLKGLDGDDELIGDGGADTLEGGDGADELEGGVRRSSTNEPGDTLSYAGSPARVIVTLTEGNVSASGGHATGDTIATIETDHDGDESRTDDKDPTDEVEVSTFENVTGSDHHDTLTGDYRDNVLKGGKGNDTLRGGPSSAYSAEPAVGTAPTLGTTAADLRGDVLYGGPGMDVLDGGEDRGEGDNDMVNVLKDGRDNDGDGAIDEDGELQGSDAMVTASIDWAVYKEAAEGITLTLTGMGGGMGTGGEADGDTLRNIELIWGSEHADTFIAGPGADIIEGDGGSDTVSYENSELGVVVDLSNTLNTSTEGDHTGAGHRTVAVGGSGTETAPFVFGPDADPAAATTAFAATTAGVPSIPENHLDSDTANNSPASPDNPETNGAAGDKLGSIENITGSAQKDVLWGDANPNVLKGMGGDDTLSGLGSNDTLYGGAGDDTLTGGADADMLNGGAGDDTLDGGAGTDTLIGGAGDDDLTGGTEADTFKFTQEDAGDSDAILDWAAGDQIDLSAFELTAEQLASAITLRGSGTDAYLIINLTEHGGGRITVADISDLDTLDNAGITDNDKIDALSVRRDLNGDGDFDDTLSEVDLERDLNNDGDMLDTAVVENGIFII